MNRRDTLTSLLKVGGSVGERAREKGEKGQQRGGAHLKGEACTCVLSSHAAL